MGKQSHQNRLAKSRTGEIMVEQNSAIDDSLLPGADELAKLKEVDPTIITWIMKRTEEEQNARIDFNKNRMKLAEYDLKRTHNFNFRALSYSFLIFLVVLALSAYFIYMGLNVQGTIFGGTAIITGVVLFVRATMTNIKHKKN